MVKIAWRRALILNRFLAIIVSQPDKYQVHLYEKWKKLAHIEHFRPLTPFAFAVYFIQQNLVDEMTEKV